MLVFNLILFATNCSWADTSDLSMEASCMRFRWLLELLLKFDEIFEKISDYITSRYTTWHYTWLNIQKMPYTLLLLWNWIFQVCSWFTIWPISQTLVVASMPLINCMDQKLQLNIIIQNKLYYAGVGVRSVVRKLFWAQF